MHQREAESRSLILGREIGLEHPGARGLVHPGAVVTELQDQVVVSHPVFDSGFSQHDADAAMLFDRVPGVGGEVQEHPLDLAALDADACTLGAVVHAQRRPARQERGECHALGLDDGAHVARAYRSERCPAELE